MQESLLDYFFLGIFHLRGIRWIIDLLRYLFLLLFINMSTPVSILSCQMNLNICGGIAHGDIPEPCWIRR